MRIRRSHYNKIMEPLVNQAALFYNLTNHFVKGRKIEPNFRKFSKYRNWKYYLQTETSCWDPFLAPTSVDKTAQSSFNAMNCIPTVIAEPIFEDIFKSRLDLPDTNQLKETSKIQRKDAIHRLTQPIVLPNLEMINRSKLFADLDSCFGLKGIFFKPVTPERAVDTLPSKTSSSFPNFIKKSENKISVLQQLKVIIWNGNMDWLNFPAVIRFRTQMRKTGIKYRQFYMFGHLILALENMFIRPFFDHFELNKTTSYCFGNKHPNIAQKIKDIRLEFKYIYSFDFSSFDQNVSDILIQISFCYIRSHLSFNNKIMENIFWSLLRYSCYCPIVSNLDGVPVLFDKTRGVMSGSILTNLLDTIINCIMLTLMRRNFEIAEIHSKMLAIMGDDCLCGMNVYISLDEMNSFFKHMFGAELSIEKSNIYKSSDNTSVYFLGYEIDEYGRYSDFELMQRQLMCSESFIPESVLPTKTRLFSKMASLFFKCSDGHKYWDIYAPLLADILGCEVPETFVQIYQLSSDPIDLVTELSIEYYKLHGWIIQ